MSLLNIEIDLSAALARLTGQPAALVRRAGILAAKRAAEQYADDIHDWIRAGKSYTPRPPVAGDKTIEQGLGWKAQGEGAVVFSQTWPRALYIEFGTRAHLIRPKPGRKALRWFPGGTGGAMIRREVHHPGTTAQPFFFADLPARQGRMLDAAREAVAEVLGAAS